FGALFTEEDHRGRGLATRLIRESVAILHKRGIAWGGVFSTENALRIYRKLGFTIPGYADRYLFLKSGEAFFNVHIRSKSLSCFLNVLYMGAIKVIYKVFFSGRWFRGKSHCKLMLEECDEYNGIAFQEKIKNSTRFRFNDSIVKLNWKIGGCGQKGENICKPYIIKVSATNEIVGYCVVRNKLQIEPIASKYKNFMMMTLMDYGLFVDDERLYLSIIDKLFDLFWESSAEVFEVVSNSETLCAALRRKGMLRVGKGMSFKFSLPESWSISDGYEQLENWHLTHFCGDSFTF
ncbi:MAG: GNAT family N-acetyltransferase, partial [Candidatus Krumholzibacteria bacterium]|nr:GNAT family N-acetyltransferase [Candidatus Krumholzibacteria bacterium]